MILSDISVRRPVFATVLSLLLVAFGILSFFQLPLRELPDVDPPIVSVQTIYRGASSNVVETRITQMVEDAISGLEGVDTISSTSRDGRSDVVIQFVLNRDIEAAANDVRSAVARITEQLPEGADLPEVSKFDADSSAIMWLNLVSDTMSNVELGDFAERFVVDRLSVIEGVARIRFGGGGLRYAMRIWLDRKAMAARGITAADIEAALRRENVELPAGSIESVSRDSTVRLERGYRTRDDFANLPLTRGTDGHIVRLGEVADVVVGTEDERYFFRGNRVPQLGMGVVKQSRANTLSTARAVKEELTRIRAILPEGTRLYQSYDSSLFIEEAVEEVYFTLSIAMGLVILVIYLFLGNIRTALIPAVTVPVCLIASFSIMAALGLSINLLTLLALVLSIGLVVDDSIVVLENVQRRIDAGEPPLAAAFRGARQVGFAVIATTAVIISVFVPIMFLPGDIGRLFSELAVAVTAAVVFSSLVALTLTPMMCSKLLRQGHEKGRLSQATDRFFKRAQAVYISALERVVKAPVIALVTVFATIGLSVFLFQSLPSELAPREDRGSFFAFMAGPPGASFDYSVEQMNKVEEILAPYTETGEIQRALARVPGSFSATEDYSTGFVIINLDHWDNRDRTAFDLIAELNGKFAQLPGVRMFAIMSSSFGRRGQSSRPVQFVLGGGTYEELAQWRDIMLERVSEHPGFIGLDADLEEKTPQLKVEIDPTRASDLGVSMETIGQTLSTMLGSSRVTTYQDRGEEYDVILQVRREDRQQPNDLTNIYVRSERTGELIPLTNLVEIADEAGASDLRRFNRTRAVTLSASLASDFELGDALTFLEETANEALPATASIDYQGESRIFKSSGSAIFFTFALALIIVFLVLSAQFESFIHPFVIMLTVPIGVAGALLGLLLSGNSLNIYSQIGIVILIGLSAKNGILIIEFANQLRDEGHELYEALMKAAETRLRPIIMTGLSTAVGATPLVLASGAGSASRQTIGIVIFFGVAFATFFTLFVVPVFYNLLAPYTRSPMAVARELDAIEKSSGQSIAPGE